jgi:molybdopterin-synthase adenylyltransferase
MESRYHRHNLIDWFSQDALAKMKAAVIGAGAVGNEVIKNLALLGLGEIHIFDLDLIEEHNLTRSVLFRKTDIGHSKAEIAAQRAMDLDGNVHAVPVRGDFWQTLSLSDLKTFNILFCCVDNFEARIRCNTMCHLARVDFINTGIDSRSALVEIFPFSRAPSAGCLECNLPSSVYSRIRERYSCGHLRKLSFIEKKMPTTIITSATAAGLAVSFGLRLGAGDRPEEAWRIYVDTITGSLTRTVLGRAEGCPCCGRLTEQPHIIVCRPSIEELSALAGLSITVSASEPILTGYKIVGQEAEYIVFKNASGFDSEFPRTVWDDPGAVEVEIRDQFTMEELISRYSGRLMPCKFAIVSGGGREVVCEFKGDRNE